MYMYFDYISLLYIKRKYSNTFFNLYQNDDIDWFIHFIDKIVDALATPRYSGNIPY